MSVYSRTDRIWKVLDDHCFNSGLILIFLLALFFVLFFFPFVLSKACYFNVASPFLFVFYSLLAPVVGVFAEGREVDVENQHAIPFSEKE